MNVNLTVSGIPQLQGVNLKGIVKTTSDRWGFNTVNKIKLDISGPKLKVRTGRLRNSIKHIISQTGSKTKIQIGSWKVPYAKIHDDLKTTSISPKTKRWLTVPVNQGVKGRARQYSKRFAILTKGGKLLIVKKIGGKKSNKIRPLFVLKAFITIKGTGYITNNVKLMTPFLKSGIELNIINAIKKASK